MKFTRNTGGVVLLTQQSYQEQMRLIEEAGRSFDRERVEMYQRLIGDRIDQRHPQANILACLYEFAKGVLSMIPTFEECPAWNLSDPLPSFEPRNQAQSVGDIVSNQKRNARKKRPILA